MRLSDILNKPAREHGAAAKCQHLYQTSGPPLCLAILQKSSGYKLSLNCWIHQSQFPHQL